MKCSASQLLCVQHGLSAAWALRSLQGCFPSRARETAEETNATSTNELWSSLEQFFLVMLLHLRETKLRSIWWCTEWAWAAWGSPGESCLQSCLLWKAERGRSSRSCCPCSRRGNRYIPVQRCSAHSCCQSERQGDGSVGFWESGSQSFPAWLSSYASFERGAVRGGNVFLYSHYSTPYISLLPPPPPPPKSRSFLLALVPVDIFGIVDRCCLCVWFLVCPLPLLQMSV